MQDTVSRTLYSLVLRYRQPVACKGFWVVVNFMGRLLLEVDPAGAEDADDKCWIYGVNPGGISAFGATPDAAKFDFMQRLRWLLADVAEEAASFRAFKSEMEKWFQTNDDYAVTWENARGGEVKRCPLSGLPGVPVSAQSPAPEREILVTQVTDPTPDMNHYEQLALATPREETS